MSFLHLEYLLTRRLELLDDGSLTLLDLLAHEEYFLVRRIHVCRLS